MSSFVNRSLDVADESPNSMEGDNNPSRLKLPGFGMPLTQTPDRLFMHALMRDHEFYSQGIKLRESRMMRFVNRITDKPGWDEKVFDETIVSHWRAEVMGPEIQQSVNLDGDVYMSEEMFEYCIKELGDKVPEFRKTGLVSVLDAEIEVVKSDSVIPESLTEALKAAVKPLEDVPGSSKDWHPGSDGKVLDLVHPSLFPMIYGTSPVLPYGKVPLDGCADFTLKGETYDVSDLRNEVVGSMQWLPSDITWDPSGDVRILSYINNLHPRDHADLYRILEKFVAAAVPLWERCLFRRGDACEPRISSWGHYETSENYYFADGVAYERPPLRPGEREDDYLHSYEYYDWNREHRILKWLEPDEYNPDRTRAADKRPDLRSEFPDGLQVIFKLASIHLDPSKPEYDGGSLHIEGALNDRIVATALYYYDVDNMTESLLRMHHTVDAEEIRMKPEQNESEHIERWLGIDTDSVPLQPLGSVLAQEGRLIAFPNVLAHQVLPFKLLDPTRPGHRKILAMFLVDPHMRVLSTSVVPPQRMDWWSREVRKVPPFSGFPGELFEMIIHNVDGLMTREDAEVVRIALMEERTMVKEAFQEALEEETYNFCEH